MATIRLVPSTYAVSSTSYLSVASASNMYTNTNSTTYATITNTNASTSSRYLYIRGFNFDDVPSNAIINSFTVKIKGYESGLSTSTSYAPRLANGTSALSGTTASENFGTSAKTITIPTGSLTWNQISSTYGSNFTITVYVRRSNKNTTGYFYCYGAEILVDYTIPVYHTVTSSTTTGTISPSGSTSILEGDGYTLTISASNPTVTDNGNNVTSQLVRMTGGTDTFHPYGYESTGYSVSDISNAYTDIDSSTRATLSLSGRTTGNIYLDLGPIGIPSTATISNVTCQASLGFSRNGSSSSATASCQLYTGSTAKGSSTTVLSSASDLSQTTFTLTPGSWTAAELANAKFYLTTYNGASSTVRYMYIYGVTLSVTYSISGEVYTYTINNVVADHTIAVTGGTIVHVTGVSVSPTTGSIETDGTLQLTATISPNNASDQSVTWSSNSTSVATVSSTGLVTGISTGSTIITVTTTDGGYTATCTITVTAPVTYPYKLATSLVVGKKYLIANGNTGSVYLLSNESGGSRQLVGIAATVSDNKIYVTSAVKAKAEFECVQYTSGNEVTNTVKSDNKYLYSDSGTGLRMNAPTTLDRFWHYQDNKFWQFKSTTANGYTDTSSEYKYYLELNSSNNFTDNHLTSPSVQDTTLPAMYIYVEDDGSSTESIYIKKNGTWTQYSKVYKKINGSWVEQASSTWTTILPTTDDYRLIEV